MFNEFLTTEGERLLAKSIAGTATITFTKIELGDGDRGTASKNIDSLESKRMTLDIYSVQLSGDNHITITSILKSENIESGFYFREKAVYATDGTTEILFMYGTAGSLAEWIQHSTSSVFERTIRTIIAFSEGDKINVTIQGGAYASGEDAKNILAAIQNIKLDGDWAKYTQAERILSLLASLDALVSSRAPASTALSNAIWSDVRAQEIDAINTNTARLTATRAGLIDNLDAKISSRAPASTALSNAVWTDARAAKQDNIDTTVSSRAAASTALNNGIWTNARASYLDLLVNGSYGLNAINNKVKKGITLSKLYSNTIRHTGVDEISIFNITGSGRLEGVYAYSNGSSANASNVSRLRIIIDGVEIYSAQSDRSRDIHRGILQADFIDYSELNWQCYLPRASITNTFDPFSALATANGVIANNFGVVLVPDALRFESSINILAYHLKQDQAAYTQVSYAVVMD